MQNEVNGMVNIAILGFGTVGSGVAEVLTKNSGLPEQRKLAPCIPHDEARHTGGTGGGEHGK